MFRHRPLMGSDYTVKALPCQNTKQAAVNLTLKSQQAITFHTFNLVLKAEL
jgi:hypothetical protein